jgi:PAS domain S-box-containing protein
MPMKKKCVLFFISFFFFISSLFAQQIRNFPALTGKKDIPANCIVQTSEGYIWIGTSDGLVRFDGKKSQVLKKENGLSSSDVTALLQTGDKTLWIGHRNGKLSRIKNNKADTFQLNTQSPGARITGFCEDTMNGIWISTYGEGLYRYFNNKVFHFVAGKGPGPADDMIYGMSKDRKGRIYMGTDAGITVLYVDPKSTTDPSQKSTAAVPGLDFHIVSSVDGLPDNIVRSISFDEKDRAIIATQDSGLCVYDPKTKTFKKDKLFNNWNGGPVTKVRYIKERKELLFSVESKGLYSLKDGKFTVTDNAKSLLSNEVNDVLVDREFNTWLATAKGVSLLFEPRHTFFTVQNGFPSNTVYSVINDAEGTTWLATDKGISTIRSSATGNSEMLSKPIAALKGKQVMCMMNDSKGRLWLGTYGVGIIIYDKTSNKTLELNSKTGLCDDNVSNLVQDASGTVWVSTLGGGVCELHEEKSNSFSYKTYDEESGLGSNYVYEVIHTKKMGVIAATDGGGLRQLHPESDKPVKAVAFKGLRSQTIYSVAEDNKGDLWFTSSDDGLVHYDGNLLAFYTTKDGIRDPQAPILAAANNKIILVHPKGIDVLSSKDPTKISFFDVSETDLEPALNGFFNDGNGKLWVATNSGLLSFRFEDIFSDTITPKAFISTLKVQYKEYPLDSVSDFPPNQNSLVFEFNALLLKSPDKVHYRYILRGYDKDWTYVSGSNVASYNNLSAGSYQFNVEASNEEGQWGPAATYSFTIAAPLWQKWWFWLLTVAITVALVYLFLRYRLHALQKEKITLENKVIERTTEIKKQSIIIQEKNKELEQLSLVASRTDNVVIIMDATGKLEYVNESFTRLNNISLEDLKAKVGETIFEISNNPRIRSIIEDCIARKQSVVYESINTKVPGKTVWESSTLTPIFDDHGVLKKLIIIDSDITERKAQEEIIVQKNKDITDSLEYAQKIQHAILPPESEIRQALPDSFLLYLMKDIVSGDFYWFAEKEDFFIIAAIDCTGHGVPGAFMSMIGYNLLNQIINEKDIHEPAKILQALNEGVVNALLKNKPGSDNKDGMDLALCKVYKNKKVIEYAGAMRPLWILNKDGAIEEIRATKMPIGSLPSYGYKETEYVNHIIPCKEGDTFYIFTDGYADQFGGTRSKKFTTGKFKILLQSMKEQNMQAQRDLLLNTHTSWNGNHEQVDDILVIGFRV